MRLRAVNGEICVYICIFTWVTPTLQKVGLWNYLTILFQPHRLSNVKLLKFINGEVETRPFAYSDWRKDRQCTYNVTLKCARLTNAVVEKSNYYIFWVGVCSRSYPTRNAHAPYLYWHLWPVWLYHVFPHHTEHKMFCLSLQLLPETLLILKIINRDIITNVRTCSLKYTSFSADFYENWIFPRQIFEKQISNFVKIRPVGAQLLHADGETDR
jgi:hypothetical protein